MTEQKERKLYEIWPGRQYQSDLDDSKIVPSWSEFITKKLYAKNACDLLILDYSWYDPQSSENDDIEDEDEDSGESRAKRKDILSLVLIDQSIGTTGLIPYIFRIYVDKKDEPEIKKFLKKHEHRMELA